MNKTELIAAVAEKTGIAKKDAELAVGAVFDIISSQLAQEDRVQISNFGTFEVKTRKARMGRNPHTKEAIEIPASRAAAFKASNALKDSLLK